MMAGNFATIDDRIVGIFPFRNILPRWCWNTTEARLAKYHVWSISLLYYTIIRRINQWLTKEKCGFQTASALSIR